MNIENDPRLTAYALGELGDDERLIFEQELANAGGADRAIDLVRRWAELLREAYAAEPVYAMSDEQRSALLADAGALPQPIALEEDVQHSDKILPWVTQPVISEVDKQKIAEALKPSPWRQIVPVIGSVGVAAGVIWLAAVVLLDQNQSADGVATASDAVEEVSEPVVINIIPLVEPYEGGIVRVVPADGEPPFRYGQPSDQLPGDAPTFVEDLFDPSFLAYRRSAIPIVHEGESFDVLRQYLADGMLPPAEAIRVEELLNAFDYGYDSPATGQTFAVDTEVADCPWDPDRQLLQVGVRAADGEPDLTAAESVAMAVEFNPATVAGYRRIGETGEGLPLGDVASSAVAAGQSVTALYEVLPRLSAAAAADKPVEADEMVTVRVDYKEPKKGEYVAGSVFATVVGVSGESPWREASDDFRFAASVARFGMMLGAPGAGVPANYDLVLDLARNSLGSDPAGERQEFVDLVEKSQRLETAKESDSQHDPPTKFASPPKQKKRR